MRKTKQGGVRKVSIFYPNNLFEFYIFEYSMKFRCSETRVELIVHFDEFVYV